MDASPVLVGWCIALALVACCAALGCDTRHYTTPVAFGPPAGAQVPRRYTAPEANALAKQRCKGRSLDVVRCYLKLHSE